MIERVIGGDNGDLYVLSRSGFYHYDKNINSCRALIITQKQKLRLNIFFGEENCLSLTTHDY